LIPLPDRQMGLDLFRLWRGSWRRTEIRFVGRSMAPLTDRAEALVLSHGDSAPRAGQILLTLQSGSLTAHRCVSRVRNEVAWKWVTQGDSCPKADPNAVPQPEILGRVVGLRANGGIREIVGPFWGWADRWAALQTRLLSRFLTVVNLGGRESSPPRGLHRWAFALHRRALSALFLMAGTLERARAAMASWQVHAFRPALWQVCASLPGNPPISRDRLEEGLRQAERYGMALLVLPRLRSTGRIRGSEDPAGARRNAAVAFRSLRWRPRIAEVLGELRRLHIPHMALKGFAQTLTLYQGDASREMEDIDLLVPGPREEEAREALRGLGFRPQSRPDDPEFLRHHHGEPLSDPVSGLLVEIHRELVPRRVLAAPIVQGFWSRASSVEFEGSPLLVPSREDRLLHLCLHLKLHRYLGELRDVFEIATMVEDDPSSWDWGRFRDVARESDCLPTAYVGLRLASLCFHSPVPEEFLLDLRGRLPWRPLREPRIRILARSLTGPPPGIRGSWVSLRRWVCKQTAPC
jgi:hypothetical protein